MNGILEAHRDALLISTDQALLDLDAICGFLSRSYWASARSRDRVEASLRNSLVFGVYDAGKQIGLARIITDYATFAWLCDVFIDEAYRGKGVGKWLVETLLAHPDLKGLKRILLVTKDAQDLYNQYGFSPLAYPGGWMERLLEELRNA
jgi:N-acetylglutamate synthase-like GNAT family acetyltransferase